MEAVEELKHKWCTDLEDLLQCPVCYERPVTPVYQCKEGHHICCSCRSQLQICPMCQGGYNGTRSFLAEHLASKLDDIKSSLMQPIIPPVEKTFTTIHTQTEVETVPEIKIPRPLAAKGKFPCKIGKCNFNDAHSRMLSHLRYFHRERLHESTNIPGKEYTRQWQMDHLSSLDFDLAFFIPEMGIFFLIASIDSGGNFVGCVQIVHTGTVAKEFKYKLEMKGNGRSCSYEGFPRSCKTVGDAAYTNSLHISSQDMRRLVDKKNKITCLFSISREIPQLSESGKKTK